MLFRFGKSEIVKSVGRMVIIIMVISENLKKNPKFSWFLGSFAVQIALRKKLKLFNVYKDNLSKIISFFLMYFVPTHDIKSRHFHE